MSNTKYFILVLVVSFLNLIALYSNHFDNSFHFDDSHVIENNTYIRSLKNIPKFFVDTSTFSTNPNNQSYRPVLSTTLAIDYYLAGKLDPFYFHLTSFSIFIVQLMVMFLMFKILLGSFYSPILSIYLSFVAVAWYAFHGAIPDTVNYISARSDMLSALFAVLSVLIFIGVKNVYLRNIYLLAIVIGMLSKEQAAVIPGLIFFYSLIFDSSKEINFKSIYTAFIKCLPSLIVSALLLVLSLRLASGWQPGGTSRLNYLLTQPLVIADYLLTFFVPYNLSADTDWKLVTSFSDIRIYLGMTVIAWMIIIFFKTFSNKKYKIVAFGLVWFFLALLPSSSIIALAEVKNDHRLYFPYIGLALSATVVIYELLNFILDDFKVKNKNFVLIGLFLTVIAFNAKVAYERNLVWDSEESLWYDVTIKSPNNGRGLMNYGLTQMSKGNYERAEKYFLEALTLTPSYSTLHLNLGILYNALKNQEKATMFYNSALRLSPNDPSNLYFYALWLKEHGKIQESIEVAKRSNNLAPGYLEVYYLLIDLFTSTANYNEAKNCYDKLLLINPGDKFEFSKNE